MTRSLPKLTRYVELLETLNVIVSIPETTFEEATKIVHGMEHLKDLVYLTSLCRNPM